MSIYRCAKCDESFDGDYVLSYEHPDYKGELCEECFTEIEAEEKNAKNPAWDMSDKDYF